MLIPRNSGLFLLDQLRKEGLIPTAGAMASPLFPEPLMNRPSSRLAVPALAFGLYKIPNSSEGESTILEAIRSGYRHFDTASYYGNEPALGRALRQSQVPREDFFICSKVWNDAQKAGRGAVRASVEKTLSNLGLDWIEVCYIHWPVPGHFVDTYKELELLHEEGLIKAIGISNFNIEVRTSCVCA